MHQTKSQSTPFLMTTKYCKLLSLKTYWSSYWWNLCKMHSNPDLNEMSLRAVWKKCITFLIVLMFLKYSYYHTNINLLTLNWSCPLEYLMELLLPSLPWFNLKKHFQTKFLFSYLSWGNWTSKCAKEKSNCVLVWEPYYGKQILFVIFQRNIVT